MYINKFDKLIDKIIDDFYNSFITDKTFSKIINESNFVRYQLKINDLLLTYSKSIEYSDINKITDKL